MVDFIRSLMPSGTFDEMKADLKQYVAFMNIAVSWQAFPASSLQVNCNKEEGMQLPYSVLAAKYKIVAKNRFVIVIGL